VAQGHKACAQQDLLTQNPASFDMRFPKGQILTSIHFNSEIFV